MKASRARAALAAALPLLLSACVDSQTHEASGAQLYEVHCASCHGPGGAGDGPVATQLAVTPPDLRSLAARAGGQFPETEVLGTIDGRREVAVHGPRTMPVWGTVFVEARSGEEMPVWRGMGDARALVDYLRSIQGPSEAQPGDGQP